MSISKIEKSVIKGHDDLVEGLVSKVQMLVYENNFLLISIVKGLNTILTEKEFLIEFQFLIFDLDMG